MDGLHLDFQAKLGEERIKILEQWLELRVCPKPWWIPNILWKKIIGRVLYLKDSKREDRMRKNERRISPSKAGLIYGKFMPSPIGSIIVMKADGSKFKHPANRAERRRLLKEERKRQEHELCKNRK